MLAVWSMDTEGCGPPRNENMLVTEALNETVVEVTSRPGYENVRAPLYRLLVDGLGAASWEIDFEKPAPEANGRIDIHLVAIIFARVTHLLELRGGHPGQVALPVYLGGALQWNLARTAEKGAQSDLLIDERSK